jgi:hypothetical protein
VNERLGSAISPIPQSAASPHRRIAASPHRRIAASPGIISMEWAFGKRPPASSGKRRIDAMPELPSVK